MSNNKQHHKGQHKPDIHKNKESIKKEDIIIIGTSGEAYLPGIQAIVTNSSTSRTMFDDPANTPEEILLKNKTYRGIVYWGSDNDLPNQILEKIEKCEVLSAGLYFNAFAGYGDGIIPCYYDYDTQGKPSVKHYYFKGQDIKNKLRALQLEQITLESSKSDLDKKKLTYVNEDIKELEDKQKTYNNTINKLKEFMANNDTRHFIHEQLIDLNFFFMSVPLIILNQNKEIVRIKHREAVFSRWEKMNPKGKIEHMFYSHRWNEETIPSKEEDLIIYDVLDADNTLYDLKAMLGLDLDDNNKTKDKGILEFIIPQPLPSPGKFYYPKSPWYAIFLSGWYDLWAKIPTGKNSIFDNVMNISYHIELSDDYFSSIFDEEGITDREKMKARIKKEYDKLNNFLTGKDNMGKSVVSFITWTHDGKEKRKMQIKPVDMPFKGGEYIEDSEEASNMIDQAIWVHPSMIGASPGKNKNINGTEARELFIIKNAIQKPFRDRVVKPFYLAKEINGWDPDLEWLIPNIELTKLDENKGSKTVIS